MKPICRNMHKRFLSSERCQRTKLHGSCTFPVLSTDQTQQYLLCGCSSKKPPAHAPAPRPGKPGIHNIRHILYSIKYYTFHFCAPIVNLSKQEFCFGNFSSFNESPVPHSCIPAGKANAPKGRGMEQKKRASLAPILIPAQGSAGQLDGGQHGA